MNDDNKNEIKIELAIQLLGDERTCLRGYELTSDVKDFEDGAVVVRELVRGMTTEYAMKHARVVGRMRATVNQGGFVYRVDGIYDQKVRGLRMEVSFRRKEDFKSGNKKTLLAVWNEEVGSEATFTRINSALVDSSVLH